MTNIIILTKNYVSVQYAVWTGNRANAIISVQSQGGNEMAVRIKPVQPTEIKDIKIIREVIEQIRKPIPPEVYERLEKEAADLLEQLEK